MGNFLRQKWGNFLDNNKTSRLEEKAINDAVQEQEFIESVTSALQGTEDRQPRRPIPQMMASQFCDNPPPLDAVVPEGYLIWNRGLYSLEVDEETDRLNATRISRIPFFIAKKDETGRALLIRYINGAWLQDWVMVKSLAARSTYLNFLIMPSKGIKFKVLSEYAFECVTCAPFASMFDPALAMLLEDLKTKHYLFADAAYPILVNVSDVKRLCQEYEIPYDGLRRWLARRNYIWHDSRVERDKKTKKPSRFIVFERALDGNLENTGDSNKHVAERLLSLGN